MNILKTTIATTMAIGLLAAMPVFAEGINTNVTGGVNVQVNTGSTTGSTSVKVRGEVRANNQAQMITRAKERANQEIDRRIASLNKLGMHIDAMKRVSDSNKTKIKATIQAEITKMTDLKAKVAADTDLATLKIDVQSITKAYRIYALIIPQGEIMAAADKIATTADVITALGVKLQTRISEAQTAGKDVTTLQANLTDLNAKVADSKVQADAAVTLTASLSPDNGDQAKFEANKKALMDARAKLKVARQDLQTARQDAEKIVKGLKALGIKSKTTASSTTEVH
jgi:hypothetical protein